MNRFKPTYRELSVDLKKRREYIGVGLTEAILIKSSKPLVILGVKIHSTKVCVFGRLDISVKTDWSVQMEDAALYDSWVSEDRILMLNEEIEIDKGVWYKITNIFADKKYRFQNREIVK